MIRRFDPIDILFIVLISCYLVTFSIIVLFFVTKYLKERKLNSQGIEKLKLPELEGKQRKVSTKSKGKKTTKKKFVATKSSTLKKRNETGSVKKANDKTNNKKVVSSKKKPNNSKKSPYTSKNKKKKTRSKKGKRK